MEKSIKDELVKKATVVLEKINISESEHNQLKLKIDEILEDFEKLSPDTPKENITIAFDIYLLVIELWGSLKFPANLSELSLKLYIDARDKYNTITDFKDRYCDVLILFSFQVLIYSAVLYDKYNKIDTKTLSKMKTEAEETYDKLIDFKLNTPYSSISSKINLYLSILLHISKKELNNKLSFESTLQEGEKVINNFKEDSPNMAEELTREFIIQLTKKLERIGVEDSDESKLLSRWLQIFRDNNTEEKTRLEVLGNILAKHKDNVAVKEKISTIYDNIQKIKLLLVVENLKDLQFGHYMNGEVLQILLNSEEEISEEENYEITGKTRLYNVAYMNDPEEGKILDSLLGFKKNISLEDKVISSPWFLMSLTNAIDELSMWSQYGNNAEGVCLEFKPDSFFEVKSEIDLEWFTSDKENTSKSKDCLYRICYLDEESLRKCEIKIKEDDNELLKYKADEAVKETRHSKIEDSLKEIKEAINDALDKTTVEDLREDLDKLLEEIRYLFKSSAYSYEKELRLLKFSRLSSNNNKIKVHKVKPAAKLYIERQQSN